MAEFYETHTHLDFPDFQDDLDQVIERAHAAGITRLITIGTDNESSRRSLELAERYPSVYAVVGYHPCHVLEAPEDIRSSLKQLAEHPKVVALGETGLDYRHRPSEESGGSEEDDKRYFAKQHSLYRQHLEVAAALQLNCVIHQRDAFEDTYAELKPFSDKVRGVFHCFVNDAAAQKRAQAIGSLVSFTGITTFKNAQSVRDTLAATPLDQFMLETDSPYLAPTPYRGKRCEPAYVKEIAEKAAEVKGVSLEELSQATNQTAESFFDFKRSRSSG